MNTNLRTIALLTALGLTAAACGSSTETADEVAIDDSSTTEVTTTTTDATTTSTTEATSTTPVPAEGDVDAYCALAAQLEDADPLADPTAPPAELQVSIERFEELLEATSAVVPSEIEDDFAAAKDGFGQLTEILEENGYDFTAAASDAIRIFDDEFTEAGERLAAYDLQVCGIELDLDGEDANGEDETLTDDGLALTLALLDTEQGRDNFIRGFVEGTGLTRDQVECFLDNADIEVVLSLGASDAEPDTETLLDLLTAFDTCGIDINAL